VRGGHRHWWGGAGHVAVHEVVVRPLVAVRRWCCCWACLVGLGPRRHSWCWAFIVVLGWWLWARVAVRRWCVVVWRCHVAAMYERYQQGGGTNVGAHLGVMKCTTTNDDIGHRSSFGPRCCRRRGTGFHIEGASVRGRSLSFVRPFG
jgi:hypothetical protein